VYSPHVYVGSKTSRVVMEACEVLEGKEIDTKQGED